MPNFDLSALALASVCPGNVLLYDDRGDPSVMVKIPKMTYAQLGMGSSNAVHPAFIVNGKEIDAIYISKYQNIVQNDRAYSLPAQEPRTKITFDAAVSACAAKGTGWHLMTRMEWGLLIRWCQANGFIPLGNNDYGKHISETVYKAIGASSGKTMTGTGPLTWFHDKSPSGIADLCGNVWEWSGGIRTVYGELQVLANNNGADTANGQAYESTLWMAINASTGALITPDGSGTTEGSLKMDYIDEKLVYSPTITDAARGSHNVTFANITCGNGVGDNTKLLLQALGMLQYGTTNELFSDQLNYFNNSQEERCFYSGGLFSNSDFGAASFYGRGARSLSNAIFGFRSAFVELPAE